MLEVIIGCEKICYCRITEVSSGMCFQGCGTENFDPLRFSHSFKCMSCLLDNTIPPHPVLIVDISSFKKKN